MNARSISQAQAEALRTNETGKNLKKRLALAQQFVADQEKLPKLDDPIDEEERQQRIRTAKISVAELTKQLTQNEYQQQQNAQKVYQELLDQRVQAVKNAAQAESLEYTRSSGHLDSVSKSLENQVRLLQVQKDLQSSISGYYEGIVGVIEKTTDNDLQRQEAAETAAIRLKSVREQYGIELQILEANQLQKQAQLDIDKLRNDAAKSQNVADIAAAEAKVAATEARTEKAAIRSRQIKFKS